MKLSVWDCIKLGFFGTVGAIVAMQVIRMVMFFIAQFMIMQ